VIGLKGRIDEIKEMEKKNGNKYHLATINGEKYSIWDPKQVEGLKQGSVVEYQFRYEKGRYKSITELELIDDSNCELGNYGLEELTGKDIQIGRMTSLKYAMEITKDLGFGLEDKIDITVDLAKRLEKYINSGNIEEEDPKR